MKARSEVSGSEARIAPQRELRLEISETAMTTTTVIATFRKNCQVILCYARSGAISSLDYRKPGRPESEPDCRAWRDPLGQGLEQGTQRPQKHRHWLAE